MNKAATPPAVLASAKAGGIHNAELAARPRRLQQLDRSPGRLPSG